MKISETFMMTQLHFVNMNSEFYEENVEKNTTPNVFFLLFTVYKKTFRII